MIEHPDGDSVAVPTARGLKGRLVCLECLLSSHLHHSYGKKYCLICIFCLFSTLPMSILFFSLCDMYKCIVYVCCMQSFVFTAYIICAVILYTLLVKGNSLPVLFPSWRLVETNLHACVCSFFLQQQGWQLPVGPVHLWRNLGCTKTLLHVAEDAQTHSSPLNVLLCTCFVPTSAVCFPLDGAWWTKKSLSFLVQLEPTGINETSAATAVGKTRDPLELSSSGRIFHFPLCFLSPKNCKCRYRQEPTNCSSSLLPGPQPLIRSGKSHCIS